MKPTRHFKRALLILGLFAFSLTSFSQVIINEFCVSNYDDWIVGGDNEDWVELYNPTGAAIDISGYWLSDLPSDPMKWEVPAGVSVPANGRLTILASDEWVNQTMTDGFWNTNFKITQTAGEGIVFSQPDGTILESYLFSDIGTTQLNHSWARDGDNGADWRIQDNPTPDGANGNSNIVGYAQKPIFSAEAGYYGADQNITLDGGLGGTIYYTTDGSTPNNTSTLYTGGILLNTTTTIRAITYSDDATLMPSFVETNTYFFGDDEHTIQIFNIAGATLDDGQWWGNEDTVIEHFDENGDFVAESQGDSNEHGNDSNAYPQRGFDYIARDQKGQDHGLEGVLFEESSDRPVYQRLIFKAAANDNYSYEDGAHVRDLYIHVLSEKADLALDGRTGEYCIVYINGEYWGVYDVREKVDDLDYTDYRYDQRRGFVDFIKTWGGTWQEYGNGQADWDNMVNFATTNDMSVQANYDYVKTQLNTNSLIDYFILNSYTVTSDWLNWNTAWWRGNHPDGDHKKWGYVLWDMDASFGHYINYTGIPDQSSDADPCNPEVLGDPGGQGHVPLLNALFNNEEFTADYINRYADLSNTYFTCDYMVGLLDDFEAQILPEMERQCTRWTGSVAGWQDNVQDLRDYMLDRCSDELVEGLEDCYDVEAVTITVTIIGEGEVELSTVTIDSSMSPWSGTYFTDQMIGLEAAIDVGTFLNWEVVSGGVVLDNPTDLFIEFEILEDVELIAYFGDPEPQEMTFVVEPAGAGDITLDGDLLGVYPYTEIIDYGSHTILASENEWYAFVEWQTAEGTNVNPDEFTIDGTIFVSQEDTIFAVFDYIEHWTVEMGDNTYTTDGDVIYDSDIINPNTWSEVVIEGEDIDLLFNWDDPWLVFDNWEVTGDIIVDDPTNPNGNFTINGDGTITPIYHIIPHFDITVSVQPEGAGYVTLDGTLIDNYPYTETLEGEIEIPFSSSPSDEWSYFSHWEVNGAVITPDEFTEDVTMNFTEEDNVVAVFTVLPHYPITVMVEPRDRGTVIVDNNEEVRTEWTGEMRGDDPVPFEVIPDEFFQFRNWGGNHHNASPDNKSTTVEYIFEQSDTIVAYIDEELFAFYLPNSFTPNNDGRNDIFKPMGYAYELEEYSFEIFNRWGVKVFETNDFDKGWDGSHEDAEHYSPDNTYVYNISIKSVHEIEPQKFVGSIMVFR